MDNSIPLHDNGVEPRPTPNVITKMLKSSDSDYNDRIKRHENDRGK